MQSKPKLRTLGTGEARERILEAAHRLFTERGVDDVTMAEVADQADVARATVFNQFGSKHGLVEAITEDVYAGYQHIVDQALAERDTPVPALIRALFAFMGFGIERDPRFYRAVFREIAKHSVGLIEGGVTQVAREAALEDLVQLLTRGQARGELTRDMRPEDLATAMDSLVFGTITHWLYADASESLELRMIGAAEVLLGQVAIAAGEYQGRVPDFGWGDDPPTVSPEALRRRRARGGPDE